LLHLCIFDCYDMGYSCSRSTCLFLIFAGTAAELEEVRALTGQKELVEGLLGGELEVDYETGEIASVIGGARYGSGSGVESSFGRRGSASGRQGQHPVSGRTNSTSSSSSSSSYDGDDWQHQATALSEDVVAARMAADPAVLHLDVQLLQDMVVSAIESELSVEGKVNYAYTYMPCLRCIVCIFSMRVSPPPSYTTYPQQSSGVVPSHSDWWPLSCPSRLAPHFGLHFRGHASRA